MNKRKFVLLMVLVVALVSVGSSSAFAAGPIVFINEIHYDNTGTDAGEAIEIAGPAGTDLTGWSAGCCWFASQWRSS